jgi:hypothetical protein
MSTKSPLNFKPNLTPNAKVTPFEGNAWTLELLPGPQGTYRLSQLDDYDHKTRRSFPWQPPLTFSLVARLSHAGISGTWGFGFWNDPFSLSFGFGGGSRRLPALPNAAWYFFASPQNYLSFRDDLPASGLLAATFQSPAYPPPLLALAVPALPLLAWKPTARLLRQWVRRIIKQDADVLSIDVTRWHKYMLTWETDSVAFNVDDNTVFNTPVSPKGPLGLVIWIDNQYAALPPNGQLDFGTLDTDEHTYLEIKEIVVTTPDTRSSSIRSRG